MLLQTASAKRPAKSSMGIGGPPSLEESQAPKNKVMKSVAMRTLRNLRALMRRPSETEIRIRADFSKSHLHPTASIGNADRILSL
jgi:hypothetical protein